MFLPFDLQSLGLHSPAELDRLRVVLVRARNPLNIGAAARAMSNFGFFNLRVVSPYDVAFREAKSAMAAAEVLRKAQEFATVAEAISDCTLVVGTTGAHNRELELPLHRLEPAARTIRKHLAGGAQVALLFGTEKFGLSNDDLSYCHAVLRIPTRPGHASMNLGQSVAVCMYELVREAKAKSAATKTKAAAVGEIDRLTEILLQDLRVSGYVKARTATSTEQKVRRLVRRLKLNAEDAELLTGMFRQIAWKLQRGSED